MDAGTETLPIFPLASVVLFPKLRVPLHLFEPRYRQLGRAATEGGRRIGMVTVRPEHVAEMSGDPPVFPIGCAGRIARSRRRPDGRYDIALVGTGRFRLVEELPREAGRLYRVARVEPLDDLLDPDDAPRVAALRARTLELVGELLRRGRARSRHSMPERFGSEPDDAVFTNALCHALSFEPAEKQGLLEADSICERLERLAQLLIFRLAELEAAGRPISGPLH